MPAHVLKYIFKKTLQRDRMEQDNLYTFTYFPKAINLLTTKATFLQYS